MQFVYPYFLFALATIALPIIIHLFHFRRFKTVYFTNVRFLKELKEETASRSRLRNLLILLMRCLAVAFMVFAFARPFIPAEEGAENKTKDVSIYIDNTFSMGAKDAEAPLLEKAKQRAREIVAAYDAEDKFQILTANFEGRHQRLVSQADALTLIDEVTVSPSSPPIDKVWARQRQTLANGINERKHAYVVSDFQRSGATLRQAGMRPDSAIHWTLVPLASVQRRNVSIDSCWLETPVAMLNQTNRLLVKINNHSETDITDIRLSLTHNNQSKPVGNVSVPAQKSVVDTVPLSIMNAGWHRAEIALTDQPITFDDKYLMAFNVPPFIRILAIEEGGNRSPYLDAVFRSTPYFQVTHSSSGALDYSKFKDYNLIIINELQRIASGLSSELQAYCKNGGNVLLFPAQASETASYNGLMNALGAGSYGGWSNGKRQVGFINTDDFIFEDVYENSRRQNLSLPETAGNFALSGSQGEGLLRYRDGSTFISKAKTENGNLFACSSPLDLRFNNLVKNAEVFVPMVYKMSLSSGTSPKIGYTIGIDNVLETEVRATSAKAVYKLKNDKNEFIPEQRALGAKMLLTVQNSIKEAGYYDLQLKQDSTLRVFAYNYDRKESVLDYLKTEELAKFEAANVEVLQANITPNFAERVGARSRGTALWKYCLIFVLLALLAEILLIRLWKA